MERGFYHPSRGYWQTNSDVPQHILDTYPKGTIEVPLKPGADFEWVAGKWQATPPAPAPVPQELSFAQLLIGLVAEGWLSVADARAWRDRVALPAQVQTLIAALPPEQQFAAETRALAPSVVLRSNPLVQALATAAGKSPEQLDDFFRTYAEA